MAVEALPEEMQDFLLDQAYAEGTRDIYARMLTDYLEEVGTLDADSFTKASVRRWLGEQDTWSKTTQWLGYSAVRAFVRYQWGDDHPVLDLSIKRGESPPQKTLTVDQAERLYRELHSKAEAGGRWGAKWRRDLSIYSMLLDTGLRSFELVSLDLSSIDMESRTVKVLIKGGNWGLGLFSVRSKGHLLDWLDARSSVASEDTSAVYVGVGGSTPGERLTTSGLRVIVRKWGRKFGMGKLSPHVFRRSFATLSTVAGAPTRMVQLAGRWKNLEEVERYTRALTLEHFDEYLPVRMFS